MVEVPKSQTYDLGVYPRQSWESLKALGGEDTVTSAKWNFRKLNQATGRWMNFIPTVIHLLWRIIN